MEYLLGGKTSDRENLKKVVNKLLFVREGVNFLCIGGNARMRHEAELLAAALTAAIPIPESQLLLRRRSFWHGLMGKVFWMYGSFWQEEKCRW